MEFASLSKVQVRALADALPGGQADVIETCVQFVCAETGSGSVWHGRGRAMLCRRLKHVRLTQNQRDRLVACILERLSGGQFSEQFRDQLRLALHLDRGESFAVAQRALKAAKPHTVRYARWVLSHVDAVVGEG